MLGEGAELDPGDPVGFREVDGGDGGLGDLYILTVTKRFYRRDARRVRLARERALPLPHIAPVMQHFRTLTIINKYTLTSESVWMWIFMLVGEPVARLRSSASP
jgi:hypothetical protein